ncbi:cell division protein FtsL [Uliginosibacterium sp. sgz301328]|uniref:cell division protein FtsL n=1 Tax=Uliginosibacterium sp. sgz301328 TaxID=3243764 RepID=UPI00359DC820
MTRISIALLALTIFSALGVVNIQYQSRKLVTAIEREQARGRALDVEWGQLQLESGTWAAHARVEKIARDRLGMVTPDKNALVALDPVVSQ